MKDGVVLILVSLIAIGAISIWVSHGDVRQLFGSPHVIVLHQPDPAPKTQSARSKREEILFARPTACRRGTCGDCGAGQSASTSAAALCRNCSSAAVSV